MLNSISTNMYKCVHWISDDKIQLVFKLCVWHELQVNKEEWSKFHLYEITI